MFLCGNNKLLPCVEWYTIFGVSFKNTYRTQARELMRDQEKRRQLDAEHPNKDFDTLVKDKMERKGLSREDALKDIINTSGKTNKKVDKSLGLEW